MQVAKRKIVQSVYEFGCGAIVSVRKRALAFRDCSFMLALGGIAVATILLASAALKVWHIQIRIWLIPRLEIEREAENLRRTLGRVGARRKAIENIMAALDQNNIIEQGRWDRILASLRALEEKNS